GRREHANHALRRGDVILASGLDVGGRLYQAEVDRGAVRLERVGLDQPVVAIAIAQVGLVPPGRQVGDVAVPVEQIERRIFLAEQVVIDQRVPDQVRAAQQVEGGGHVAPV